MDEPLKVAQKKINAPQNSSLFDRFNILIIVIINLSVSTQFA